MTSPAVPPSVPVSAPMHPCLVQFDRAFANICRIRHSETTNELALKIMASDPVLSQLQHMEQLRYMEGHFYHPFRWKEMMKDRDLPYVLFHCAAILCGKNSQRETPDMVPYRNRTETLCFQPHPTCIRYCNPGTRLESLIAIDHLAKTVMTLDIFHESAFLSQRDTRFGETPETTERRVNGADESDKTYDVLGHILCREWIARVAHINFQMAAILPATAAIPLPPPLLDITLQYLLTENYGRIVQSPLVVQPEPVPAARTESEVRKPRPKCKCILQ